MNPIILEKDQSSGSLGLAAILPKVQHFFVPNLLFFYADFTLSTLAGNILLLLAVHQTNWSLSQAIYVIGASLALFRATIFVHETYHLSKRLKGFVLYYNLLHGFLHKIPFYGYAPHRYHHLPETYGTIKDPEYETLGDKSAFHNIFFAPIVMMITLPLFLAIRWGIIPFILPFIGEKARLFIYEYATAIAMNLRYKRPLPSKEEKKQWYIQDCGCAIYTVACAWLIISGILPWTIIPLWFVTFYLLAVLNFYRAMMNHRYFTSFEVTSHKQQIIDSVTLPMSLWVFLLYPLSLNYHTLHHMFPQIPYHNMGKAHRTLMEILPEDHPYRLTMVSNYFSGLKQFLARKF